jgi:transposase InsO family protein
VAGGSVKNTLYLWDRRTGRSYLVDTGADVCVFPASADDKKHRRPSVSLTAANGSPIRSWGTRTIPLDLGGKRLFNQDFYVADVTQPILGADFFIANHLAIDMRGRRIVDLESSGHIPAIQGDSRSPYWPGASGISTTAVNDFARILQEFPELLVPHFNPVVNKHGVEHFILTEGPPLHARARRLDAEKLAVAQQEFANMEALGIIRRSKAPWASPLHVVPKPNGGWRPCGDYRRLNDITVDDRYPLPHIQDFNSRLADSNIFSKIDLVRGYHQIPVAADSIPKTAIITPFGLWEFVCMPFGLKNAAQAFQRLMDGILRGVPFVFVYLDDILIASNSPEQHAQHLRHVFGLLSANGLVISKPKCIFGVSELDFLGHRVTPQGIRPMPDRVSAITAYPIPSNRASLQRFLGMINYYHRFLPKIAGLLSPLHAASSGRGQEIEWTEKCQAAFEAARSALATATLLHHPRPDSATSITTDASDIAVGAQLEQLQRGKWVPIAFFSKKLSDAEKKYSAFDRELLATYLAVKHFSHFVEGRKFTLYTDHKPLTFAMSSAADRSPRQTRHLSFVAEFTTDLQHVPGKQNVVADALSRVTAVSGPQSHKVTQGALTGLGSQAAIPIDFELLAAAQAANANEMANYRTAITGLVLRDVPFGASTLLCDVSTGPPRPVLPKEWTRRAFDAIHNLSHAGVRPTQKAVASRFVWHGLRREVRRWCQECQDCQPSKIHRHVRAPLVTRDPPDGRFSSLHIDLVGPLPESEGMVYLLTIIDRFTRWPEAIPIPNAHTTTIAKHFIRHWIARFGVPEDITSDRGPQFTSRLWAQVNKLLGIATAHTTAYHPQANGMVERLHRQLKAAIKARTTGPNWMDELPFVLLGVRSAWREDPDCSPADLVYGSSLRLPGEFFRHIDARSLQPSEAFARKLQQDMRQALPPPPAHHSARASQVPANLSATGYVYVRKDRVRGPLERPYDGPYRIIATNDKFFTIDYTGTMGYPDKVSIDRLKPAVISPQPVRRVPTTLPAVVPAAVTQAPAPLPINLAPLPTSRSGRPLRPTRRWLEV